MSWEQSAKEEEKQQGLEQPSLPGINRLLDMITREVSLVDKGANRRTWLVRKGQGGQEGQAVNTMKPVTDLESALTLVTSIMDKTDPNWTDESILSGLSELHAWLGGQVNEKLNKEDKKDKKDKESEHGAGQGVSKAGAKMSAARRKQFRGAIETLISLFQQIVPDQENEKVSSGAAGAKVAKQGGAVAEAQGQLQKLSTELAQTKQDLEVLRQALGQTKMRVQQSNVLEVASINNGSKETQQPETIWPADFNSTEDDVW